MRNILMCVIILWLGPISGTQAQQTESKVRVKNADNFVFENLEGKESIQYLKGNVKMEHDSTFMYADSAIIREELLSAVGNISIIQSDSTFIFSDSLSYNSNTYEAELFTAVVLENGPDKLFTDKLNYNTNTKLASYQDTALLTSPRTQLSSIKGTYDLNTKLAKFINQVVVIDSSFTLYTDSLIYNTSISKAIFIGPTYIFNGEREIYCEDGFYLINEGKAYFTKNAYLLEGDKYSTADEISYSEKDSLLILKGNAQYQSPKENASAETIIFDDLNDLLILQKDAYYEKDSSTIEGPVIKVNTKEESLLLEQRSTLKEQHKVLVSDFLDYSEIAGQGISKGNIIWRDTLEHSVLWADELIYRDEHSFLKSYGDNINPLFLKVEEADSLYLSADTLTSFDTKVQLDSITSDTVNIFIAHYDVKIWNNDLRAVADSLYYSSQDSTYKLYGNPIIWTDSTEYKGDTILIKMENGKVKELESITNAFIINKHNEKYFDQIKGKRIITLMDSNSVKQMNVINSAESIYFLKDELEAFIGPNHTKCSKISFYFEDEEVKDVKFYDLPESVLTPIQQANQLQLFLPEFEWKFDERPVSWESIRIRTYRKKVISVNADGKALPMEKKQSDEFSKAVDEMIDKKNIRK